MTSGERARSSRRRRASSLPLSSRLPNPSACYVGREAEQHALSQLLVGHPVVGVWGPGGYGKTELVLKVLASSYPRQVEDTVYLGLPACDDVAMEAELVRVVAAAAGAERLDWPALLARREARITALLDLAETCEQWVVIDDVHRGERTAVRALLADICRYARRSRWIVISRQPFDVPALADRILALGAMERAPLSELAQRLRPEATDEMLAAALTASAGSPWRLKNHLGGVGPAPDPAASALAGCSPEQLALLTGLSVIDEPLLVADACRFTAVLHDDALAALEQRGLVVRSRDRLRLHDVARPLVAWASGDRRALARDRAIEALSTSDDTQALLEAIRLAAADRRILAVRACLERHGAALLDAGHGERLWRHVRTIGDPALESWRLRIAVEAGPAAAHEIEPPTSDRDVDVLAWARVLSRRSEMRACAELLEPLATRARVPAPTPVTVEAAILWARVQNNLGESRRAATLLAAVGDSTPELDALRDAMHALSLAILGSEAEAWRLLERCAARSQALGGPARCLAAQAYYELGRLPEAGALLEGDDGETTDYGPNAMLLTAAIALERAQLELAQRWSLRTAPIVAAGSPMGLTFQYIDVCRRVAAGALRDIDSTLAALDDMAAAASYARFRTSVECCRIRLAALRAEPAVAPASAIWPEERSLAARLLYLEALEARARQDGAGELDPACLSGERPSVELAGAGHRAAAALALTAGRPQRALDETRAGLAAIERAGYELVRADLLRLRADACIVADEREELARTVAAIAEAATRWPSARLAAHVALLTQIADDAIEPAQLEELADGFEVAPVVARRARFLLGGDPPLDRIDRVVLDALSRRGWRRAECLTASHPWQPGFGLDERTMSVWRGGRRLPLSRRPTPWRLLRTLYDRGGQASKEQLVLAVWDEPDYHPLTHDNRLKLAVGKLRRAVEEALGDTEWIATTETGYALRGPTRLLRA